MFAIESYIVNTLQKIDVANNYDKINIRLYDYKYTYNEIIYSLLHKKVIYFKKNNNINVLSVHIRMGKTWYETIGNNILPIVNWKKWSVLDIYNKNLHDAILQEIM